MLRLTSFLLACTVFATTQADAQSCSFSVAGINFGNVDTLTGAAVDTTGAVNVSCDGGLLGANFRICLNLNAGSGGATSGTRHARSATNAALDYNFYQDATRSTPWGSVEQTTLGNPVAFNLSAPALGGSASAAWTIYARVLANQQSAATGLYTSVFSGTHVRFNYATYVLTPPACTSVTQNPTRPSFDVQANVTPNCMVTAQDINFGNHGVLNTAIDATGGIDVTCTLGTAYTVGLNDGLNGDSPTVRRMSLGGGSVIYGLYKDASWSQPLGNSGGGIISGTGAGTTQKVPVYGRVPPQPTPSPGTYTDTVVVTVTY